MPKITIPPEAVEAAAREVAEQLGDDWDDNRPRCSRDLCRYEAHGAKEACRAIARAAILAALSAWPGVRMMVDIDTGDDSALKLPLPQEKSDD